LIFLVTNVTKEKLLNMTKLVLIVLLFLPSFFDSCMNKETVKNTVTQNNKPAKQKNPIPKSLDALDLNSENMYAFILKKDWNAAEKQYQKVQEEFYTLSPYLIKDSIPTDYIVSLETAVKFLSKDIEDKNQVSAMTDANNITNYMCDAADYFVTDFPSNLRRVHVYTRNIEICVLQNDWEGAKTNFAKVNAYWPKVKNVLSAKSEQKVKEFEESLVDFDYLLKKQDDAKILKQTQIMRDRTEALEKYYEN
jgi:hypothetical protein